MDREAAHPLPGCHGLPKWVTHGVRTDWSPRTPLPSHTPSSSLFTTKKPGVGEGLGVREQPTWELEATLSSVPLAVLEPSRWHVRGHQPRLPDFFHDQLSLFLPFHSLKVALLKCNLQSKMCRFKVCRLMSLADNVVMLTPPRNCIHHPHDSRMSPRPLHMQTASSLSLRQAVTFLHCGFASF